MKVDIEFNGKVRTLSEKELDAPAYVAVKEHEKLLRIHSVRGRVGPK